MEEEDLVPLGSRWVQNSTHNGPFSECCSFIITKVSGRDRGYRYEGSPNCACKGDEFEKTAELILKYRVRVLPAPDQMTETELMRHEQIKAFLQQPFKPPAKPKGR